MLSDPKFYADRKISGASDQLICLLQRKLDPDVDRITVYDPVKGTSESLPVNDDPHCPGIPISFNCVCPNCIRATGEKRRIFTFMILCPPDGAAELTFQTFATYLPTPPLLLLDISTLQVGRTGMATLSRLQKLMTWRRISGKFFLL